MKRTNNNRFKKLNHLIKTIFIITASISGLLMFCLDDKADNWAQNIVKCLLICYISLCGVAYFHSPRIARRRIKLFLRYQLTRLYRYTRELYFRKKFMNNFKQVSSKAITNGQTWEDIYTYSNHNYKGD